MKVMKQPMQQTCKDLFKSLVQGVSFQHPKKGIGGANVFLYGRVAEIGGACAAPSAAPAPAAGT